MMSQGQGSAQVIQLVVINLGLFSFPLQLYQGFEAARFVDKAAIDTVAAALGDEIVGLPQELGHQLGALPFLPIERLANAATKGIVVVAGCAAIRQLDRHQLMLTIVLIAGHQ
ncbi:hypothetical protein D3C78_759350 [compost metagenome]